LNKTAKKLTDRYANVYFHGGKSTEPHPLPPPLPSTMGSAPEPRWRLCPEIPVIPIDNFRKFVAFALKEILRDLRIKKIGHVSRLRPFVSNFAFI